MKARVSGAMAVVLVPVLVAACGGKQEPGAAKARYIRQSDAICREVFPRARAAGDGRDQATAEKLQGIWQDAANRLKALPPPKESLELARQFVTDVENLSLAYTAAANAAALNDQSRVDKSLREVAQIKARAADTADTFGYDACSQINR